MRTEKDFYRRRGVITAIVLVFMVIVIWWALGRTGQVHLGISSKVFSDRWISDEPILHPDYVGRAMDSVRIMKRLAAGDSEAVRVALSAIRAGGVQCVSAGAGRSQLWPRTPPNKPFSRRGGRPRPSTCSETRRHGFTRLPAVRAVDVYRRERRHRVDRVDEPDIVALPPFVRGDVGGLGSSKCSRTVDRRRARRSSSPLSSSV